MGLRGCRCPVGYLTVAECESMDSDPSTVAYQPSGNRYLAVNASLQE